MGPTTIIGVRVTEEQRVSMQAAADSQEKPLSVWIRDMALEAAEKTGATVKGVLGIPGVHLGIPVEVDSKAPHGTVKFVKDGKTVQEITDIGDAPVEDVPTRPWLPQLVEMTRMEESEATQMFQELTRGMKMPVGFTGWRRQNQALWLDQHCPLEEKS